MSTNQSHTKVGSERQARVGTESVGSIFPSRIERKFERVKQETHQQDRKRVSGKTNGGTSN